MFLPGGLNAGALLPWILFAPALPLLAAIIRRPAFNASFISLLIFTVVSLLSGIFNYLSATQTTNEQVLHFTLFLDSISTFLLLYIHCRQPILKQVILTVGLLFPAVFLALMLVGQKNIDIGMLIGTGYTLIFLGSVAVLLSQLQSLTAYVTVSPTFWICVGLCFHYGLTGLLFWLDPGGDAADLIRDQDFGIVYTIILVLKYIFFSAAVFLYKSLNSSNTR